MRIEAYDFGSITINGTRFTSDLKIIGDNVIPRWWRVEGHNLLPADIEDIIEAKPEVLIVGTGDPGLMVVSEEVRKRLSDLGIEVIAKPTRQACQAFNHLSKNRNVAFAAHLTC